MKSFVAIILAVLYFSTTSGMVMNIHYCMGKIASVKMKETDKDGCNRCASKSKKDCCKNEFKVVKLNVVHEKAATNNEIKIPATNYYSLVTAYLIQDIKISDVNQLLPDIPPLLPETGIYIKNCVFRI